MEGLILLVNGRVRTLNAANPITEAMAIADGRIAAVGRKAQGAGAVPENARRADLRGKTVLPGLIDAHTHLDGSTARIPQSLLWDVLRRRAADVPGTKARPGRSGERRGGPANLHHLCRLGRLGEASQGINRAGNARRCHHLRGRPGRDAAVAAPRFLTEATILGGRLVSGALPGLEDA